MRFLFLLIEGCGKYFIKTLRLGRLRRVSKRLTVARQGHTVAAMLHMGMRLWRRVSVR
jgi:hypothetical protein